MKRASVVVVLLALLLVAAPGAMAKSTVTVNPLGFLVGAFSVEYETEIGRGPITLGVPVFYWSVDTEDLKLTATAFGGGVRYYLEGVPHEGFYVGAYAVYASVSGKSGSANARATALGLTGAAGYKFTVRDNFVVDIGVGVGFPVSTNVTEGDIKESQLGGARAKLLRGPRMTRPLQALLARQLRSRAPYRCLTFPNQCRIIKVGRDAKIS